MDDIAFLPVPPNLPGANIKVVGVGGAGCNALNRMIESGVSGVQFIAMNTDQQSLAHCMADVKIPLGPDSMRGLGAGGDPEQGSNAAEESRDELLASLRGADMVFITAGLGGGTGTGAAPVVANCAKGEINALTVAVVLTPFLHEGHGKAKIAADGLNNLRNVADSVIVVSNEKLLGCCDRNVKMKEAFRVADSVLIQGVRGITDLILRPGIVNGDFADVRSVLCDSREALIGTGSGRGEEAILDAVKRALACPLLERDKQGIATKVIVSVIADWDQIELSAMVVAMNHLRAHYKDQPDIKLCQAEAPELDDRALVTILASGFLDAAEEAAVSSEQFTQDNDARERAVSLLQMPTRAYGDPPVSLDSTTPTRLLPQAPTPSGELEGLTQDLHVPAIIRLFDGRLPI